MGTDDPGAGRPAGAVPVPPPVTVTVQAGSTVDTYVFHRRTTVVVGRAADCGIRVDDGQRLVSRRHCQLDVDPPHVRIRDLGSRHGTHLNGRPVDGGQHLSAGDEVRVGRATLRVTLPDDGTREAAAGPEDTGATPTGATPTTPDTGPPGPERGRALPALVTAAAVGAPGLDDFTDHRVLREIGRGGHSVVYLARHEPSGRLVALKTLLADRAVDPAARDAFRREIACVRGLRHRNVVALHSSGAADAAFFFTCEYCPGGSVAEFVARRGGRLPVDEALPITLDALDALAYAHRAELAVVLADGRTQTAHGLVHRDVTPHNLLLTTGAGGEVVTKVADFGLAKAFEKAGLSGHTGTGAIGGSLAFQPRAQLIDYRYARPEVDLWAVTACLYWMLTGTTPRDFPAGADPVAVVLRTRPVPVRQRDGAVPARLADVIDEMLVDQPRVAATTAAALADALRQAR
ncbi:FHA domain-containing serine/threonine-protein kinase [Micromonospora sp. NPDC048894]|uniref:FHA domain-containing serine/threonine-protein kinase n=1 Tax=unclassified Micromonospora TaxID=2617518 RepID=UPI0033E43D10